MSPTNNFSKQKNVNFNHNRLSQQSKPTNMTTPNSNPNPSIGNGSMDQTPNPPPTNYNRNNSSLRMFSDWLEKAEKIKHNASNSSQIKHNASNSSQIKHNASNSSQIKHNASNSSPVPATATALAIDESDDVVLSKSKVLTREEVLKRRSNRMKSLMKVYKDHYWAMAEELKLRHREYYWEYGKSPFQEDEVVGECADGNNSVTEGFKEENNKPGMGLSVKKCEVHGCKVKAMALTRFCHAHILSDPNQKLYKGCTYVTKSSATGPMYCMKPVMRSTVPLLCSLHLGKAEKHVAKALRKAGHTSTSKSKAAPKLHLVIAEFLRQTQAKRRRIALVESKK